MKTKSIILSAGLISLLIFAGCKEKPSDSNASTAVQAEKTTASAPTDELAKRVLAMGLKPIPTDPEELRKLTEDVNNTFSEEKIAKHPGKPPRPAVEMEDYGSKRRSDREMKKIS